MWREGVCYIESVCAHQPWALGVPASGEEYVYIYIIYNDIERERESVCAMCVRAMHAHQPSALESPPAARETLKEEKLRPKVTDRPTMRPSRIGSPRRPCLKLFYILIILF
jgi:hypothetical protein